MDKVLKIQNLIRESKNIVFLSGAGISTNSGLPDFRSDNGFWKTNKPIMFRDFLSSLEARQLSWERNIALNETIERIKPNTGHLFVKEVLDKKDGFIITQNIDGLHRSHKFKDQIVEIHGSVHTSSCLSCNKQYETLKFYEENILKKQNSNCNSCKDGLVKVDTISFGQALSQISLKKAQEASENCDFFIAVGTSLKVSPANQLPNIALQNNAKLIILNKEETSFDRRALLVINEDLEEIHEQIN